MKARVFNFPTLRPFPKGPFGKSRLDWPERHRDIIPATFLPVDADGPPLTALSAQDFWLKAALPHRRGQVLIQTELMGLIVIIKTC